MTLEQLKSLTEDEVLMLWYIINKIEPAVMPGIELEPGLFTSVNREALLNRINKAKPLVKEEHIEIYNSIVSKLK